MIRGMFNVMKESSSNYEHVTRINAPDLVASRLLWPFINPFFKSLLGKNIIRDARENDLILAWDQGVKWQEDLGRFQSSRNQRLSSGNKHDTIERVSMARKKYRSIAGRDIGYRPARTFPRRVRLALRNVKSGEGVRETEREKRERDLSRPFRILPD